MKPQQNPPAAEMTNPAEPVRPAEPTKDAKTVPEAAQPAAETNKKEAAANKEKAPVEKVTPTNCVQCNKSIRKIRWYYRDGKYYCTKRCWVTAIEKIEKKAA